MHCETRVGEFTGDLGELTRHYSPNFMSLPIGRPDIPKPGLVERHPSGSYILMVSNSDGVDPRLGYNLIVTVMGPLEAQAKAIMDAFEEKVPIELRHAPDFLQRQYDSLMKLLMPE